MKPLNNLRFIAEASAEVNKWIDAIENAETWEQAKEKGAAALGYIDCLNTYGNVMVDKENNAFTAELDELTDRLCEDVYQHMGHKALTTGQPVEIIRKMHDKADAYRG